MTLDEVIKHEEEVAEKNEKKASWFWGKEGNPNYENCVKCAEEHRQLAEWLKELKQLREQTRWIPCNERLPKENVKVLTQDNEGNIQVDWLLHLELRWFYSQHHIVAWQPLSKPYEGETHEKNN